MRITEQVAGTARGPEVGTGSSRRQTVQRPARRNDFTYLIDFGIAHAAEDTRLTTRARSAPGHDIAPERLAPSREIPAPTSTP